jgi:GrpB-like predicted nucleotidyltransferase (UPF0157 family)
MAGRKNTVAFGLTLKELWELFPIELREYCPVYPAWYAAAEAELRALLGNSIYRSSHIGSTAVEGLLSKPIIDILLEVRVTEGLDTQALAQQLAQKLTADGWLLMNSHTDNAFRLDFNKGYTPQGFAEQVYHLHVVLPGDHDELYFRDYLRTHAKVREDYATLKLSLLAIYQHDRDGYTEAKSDFIKTTTKQARLEFPGRHAHRAR